MENLKPHQSRVVAERDELAERYNKLGDFRNTVLFESLEKAERQRLEQQHRIMGWYLEVLNERIEAFAP